jgi:DGQHR domain-containing protein
MSGAKKVQVITFDQSGYRCHIGVMAASDLVKFTKIDRYDPSKPVDDNSQGYQRPEDATRIKKLANFLRNEERPLVPTSVLLSSRGVDLRYDPQTREISLRENAKLQIVDGQHRVGGLRYAIQNKNLENLSNFPLPVVIIETIDKLGEMKQFQTVNGTQKGVRTDLVNSIITQMVSKEGDESVKQADHWKVVTTRVVDILNDNDENSPWYDMIVKPGGARYSAKEIEHHPELEHKKIIRATSFTQSLKPVYNFLLELGFLRGSTQDQAVKLSAIVDNFWKAVKNMAPEMFENSNRYVLQKAAGINALHLILRDLIRDMYIGRRDWTVDNFQIMLEDFPSLTNASFWYVGDDSTLPGDATHYSSMKGVKQLVSLFFEEREDSRTRN